MWYVYLLRDTAGKPYLGYTNDLRRRLAEHQRKRRECMLVYYEAYGTADIARVRERMLKQYGGAWRSLRKRLREGGVKIF